ncbi:MAG: hypothetical protein RIT26_1641 [Pseudomonadota bacterium]|jgi:transcriptional regulator with XRE-family HTH domain
MKNKLIIIDALETARESAGLTQAELAQKAGTSRVTVGRIEAGFDPKLSTVYELARALGLELTLVPKSLAGEVQAFLRSGGRALAQPVGASAPPSVVDLAAVARGRSVLTGQLMASESTAGPVAVTPPPETVRRHNEITKASAGTHTHKRPTLTDEAAKLLGLGAYAGPSKMGHDQT